MAALLSVALLPIGLIAVMQTQSVARQSQSNAELALLALTERAAYREQLALHRARGVAVAAASVVSEISPTDTRCSDLLAGIVAQTDGIEFLGLIPPGGLATCTSVGATFEVEDLPIVVDQLAAPISMVFGQNRGFVSEAPALVITTPLVRDGEFGGHIAVSVPHRPPDAPERDVVRDALIQLVTFNAAGDVLTATDPAQDLLENLPPDIVLEDLIGGDNRAITFSDTDGGDRIYTVASIEPNQAYILGIWDSSAQLAEQAQGQVLTSLFPAVMWFAGLMVALFAVHRLVTRHLQILGRQMALFTAARRVPTNDVRLDPPTEIRRIQNAFHRMTEALVRDEASLENAVHEKSVLVKEIHHRVKNNLQLISSVINMQIRTVAGEEAKSALRQTQERVLSMATIHRDLYQTNETGLVNAGRLIREVVRSATGSQVARTDLDVDIDVADVWLYPDQAVPLSLLTSEVVLNALKHMKIEDSDAGGSSLTISFVEDSDRACILRVTNPSCGPDGDGGACETTASKGIGQKLIAAFATQLAGDLTTGQKDDRFTLELRFQASDFAHAPGNY